MSSHFLRHCKTVSAFILLEISAVVYIKCPALDACIRLYIRMLEYVR